MPVKAIISAVVAFIIDLLVYSPIVDALKGVILDVAKDAQAPFWFTAFITVIFFIGSFGGIYALLTAIGGDI